jgi:hypothetical protein
LNKVEIRMTAQSFGHADLEVFLNGDRVAGGHIGGEPEDNSYYRDYGWIKRAIAAVARRLGAEVELTEIQDPEGTCESR